MLQQAIIQQSFRANLQKLINFIQFSRSFLRKRNPVKAFVKEVQGSVKEFLAINKKIKMARYRLNYQKYRLSQMEQIIAQNNEHVFLRGRTLNETR